MKAPRLVSRIAMRCRECGTTMADPLFCLGSLAKEKDRMPRYPTEPEETPNEAQGRSAANAGRAEVQRRVLREMKGREIPTFIEQVRGPDGQATLLIVERMPRGAEITDAQAAMYVRTARAAAGLLHKNIVRCRVISVRPEA